MIAALLLAAGKARRFGADKLMAELPDGTPLAVASLRAVGDAVDQVIAVVSPDAPVAPLLRAHGARIVVAHEAERGLGHSIAAGIHELMTPATDGSSRKGCLIALADMPFVRHDTVKRLADALRGGASLVTPDYRGTRGHPVGFARDWFGLLATLEGDRGARDLLAVHRHAVERISVDDAGILADVDRPADLEALLWARTRSPLGSEC